MKPARHVLSLFLSCLFVSFVVVASSAAELAPQLRRPIALVPSAGGDAMYVANRDSGTVSKLDITAREVTGEFAIGKRLADLVAIPGSDRLLAADEGAHELLVLEASGDSIEVRQRLAVSPYPVSICIAPHGKQATIASLWSRRLTFIELGESLQIAGILDLPFAPRCQLRLPSGELLVADSFSGRLAMVDPVKHELLATREFPGHNIRGLGVSPGGEMLIVSHQMLNELAHSIRNDIHWGLLMSNDLRWLKVESVLAGGKSLYHGAHMHPLGESGKGGGDPGGVDVAADGTVCVAISGVDQVAIGKEGDFSMFRVNVGRRPTAVRIAQDGQTAFVANTFDDSVSIVDLKGRKIAATISLGPQPELSVVEQGELLFHNAKLSHDGWMSCHSCHTDGHANGQMNDNFSDKSFGAPKRVLSLLGGVKDTLPLAWNGQVQTLARQIHNSVETTMQREDQLPQTQVQALAAYVNSLAIPPPLDLLRGTQDAAAIERGRVVFEKRDCASCHAAPTYTTPATYDVGLKDAQGNTEFNPPSLRGLSHRGPFFHDNSAATLEEVFLKRGHPSDAKYSESEINDLAAFLRSL